MRFTKTGFVFAPEFGARLRRLREQGRLSLRGMASLMDRSRPGSFNLLARLERGELKHPSINLIADYLRACGARVGDIADLLDPYLSRPPVPKQRGDAAVAELLKSLPKPEQRAMLKWEKATAERREEKVAAQPGKKRPRVETDRQRVFRIVWMFIHANWNEVFEQQFYEALLKLGDEVPRSRRKDACNHARRFAGILTRHYRQESRRTGALARVERQAKQDGFSNRVVAVLRAAADQGYRELLLSGRLDWEPTAEELVKRRGYPPRVEKAELRLEIDEARPVVETNKTLSLIDSLSINAVCEHLDEMKVAHHKGQQYYIMWVRELVAIAYAHGTDSPEWKASVAQWAPKLPCPGFAPEAAKMTADIYNRWKVRLPPKPA
jgi:transcriptional regulator with XRE-family HTH domain